MTFGVSTGNADGSKVMTSPGLACCNASRKEPEPLSSALVTMMVSPFGGGIRVGVEGMDVCVGGADVCVGGARVGVDVAMGATGRDGIHAPSKSDAKKVMDTIF